MESYVLKINEKNLAGKNLIRYLESLSKTVNYIDIIPKKAEKEMNRLDEAIEDIKMGRVTTYDNYEEYEKAVNKMLGYV